MGSVQESELAALAIRGQYTWEQIPEWFGHIQTSRLGVPGADLVSNFMENRNRPVVEIDRERNPDIEAEVEDVFSQLWIPLDAVVIIE